MKALRHWSFGRVLLVCVAWFFLSVVVEIGWILVQSRAFFFQSSGGGGIGAVSVGISESGLLVLVVPPMVLIAAWLVARRLKSL